MKKIFLIDCPGVVPYDHTSSEADIVLKGVVRVEYIKDPYVYIDELLKRVEPKYIQRTYGIVSWEDGENFLEKMAVKFGRLLKVIWEYIYLLFF